MVVLTRGLNWNRYARAVRSCPDLARSWRSVRSRWHQPVERLAADRDRGKTKTGFGSGCDGRRSVAEYGAASGLGRCGALETLRENTTLFEDVEIRARLNHMLMAMKMLTTLARAETQDCGGMKEIDSIDDLETSMVEAHGDLAATLESADLDKMIALPAGRRDRLKHWPEHSRTRPTCLSNSVVISSGLRRKTLFYRPRSCRVRVTAFLAVGILCESLDDPFPSWRSTEQIG
jgi:hypothetical protein